MGLMSLPAPTNEYKLLMPDLGEDEPENENRMVEDAEDILKKEREAEMEKEQLQLRLRSKVLKQGLPRPLAANAAYVYGANQGEGERERTEAMVAREMLAIVAHEAQLYPQQQQRAGQAKMSSSSYETYGEDELEEARNLLQAELAATPGQIPRSVPIDLLEKYSAQYIFVPESKSFVEVATAIPEQKLTALQGMLQSVQAQIKKETSRATKTEKRLNVYNGGYQAKAAQLRKQIVDLYMELDKAQVELHCFDALRQAEERAVPSRLQEMARLLEDQTQREALLQSRYASLLAAREEALCL